MTLEALGIEYEHLKDLGGLRHAAKESVNLGWRSSSFRGFADYMQTEAFWNGLAHLESVAKKQKTALMCAEAVPWRCHRSLVADALTIKKWRVLHILSKTNAKEHELTSFLQVKQGKLIYA
jgi:uncharacterized protein (DUF488 family)